MNEKEEPMQSGGRRLKSALDRDHLYRVGQIISDARLLLLTSKTSALHYQLSDSDSKNQLLLGGGVPLL